MCEGEGEGDVPLPKSWSFRVGGIDGGKILRNGKRINWIIRAGNEKSQELLCDDVDDTDDTDDVDIDDDNALVPENISSEDCNSKIIFF